MAEIDLKELKAMAAALKRPRVDSGGRQLSLDEIVGESYVKELAAMSEAEAVQHLRAVSGEKLFHAYLVLSARPTYPLRANHPVFAEVCLRWMESTKVLERSMGAGDVGIWLAGTNEKNASRLLALMISNPEETEAVRSAAYTSLELINNKKTGFEIVRRKLQARDSPVTIPSEIDWDFVRRFL
jgi:hypothetical protein